MENVNYIIQIPRYKLKNELFRKYLKFKIFILLFLKIKKYLWLFNFILYKF